MIPVLKQIFISIERKKRKNGKLPHSVINDYPWALRLSNDFHFFK